MSELKAVHAFDVYEAYTKTGDDDAAQVYLKSEADKAIEELKHQRDGAFGLANLGLTLDGLSQMAKKEIDRHKYKRCVAMASYWVAVSYQCVDDKHRQRAEKHHRKWLDIAKRFEEAK